IDNEESNPPLISLQNVVETDPSDVSDCSFKDSDFEIDSGDLLDSGTGSDDQEDLATESEIVEEDFDLVNSKKKKQPNVIILQDIQIKKPEVNVLQVSRSIASHLKETKRLKTRFVKCIFCEEDTISKNFMRHLMRRHSSEVEVKKILREPLNSKARKGALAALRKETHFERYLCGDILPARRKFDDEKSRKNPESLHYPCTFCKGLYKKSYLRRHVKLCSSKSVKHEEIASNAVSKSQTFTACNLDQTNTVNRLEVKEKVFDMMRGDEIAFAAKKDLLITCFGNSYLKKHKQEKSTYTCSNKMREFGRLLTECRKLIKKPKLEIQNLLRPTYFDTIVTAVRSLAGYDPIKKSFAAPSLALHFGGNLKIFCDELYYLILKDTKGFKSSTHSNKIAALKDVKNMKQIIISRWNIELSSLANKDLHEKKWNKPLLIPLVSDIKLFREQTYEIARRCASAFKEGQHTEVDYKTLVRCVLSLLIIFYRRRICDVQYMKISDYKNEQKSNFKDFEEALSTTEKVLATRYRRVLNSGHKVKWGRGDLAIRNLAKRMPLQNPAAFTSNRLRKQIATVMQILSLSKDDIKQFSNFMGHTVKTHEEFYELPVDVYQTAKVSKLLLMIENGVPVEHKGKSLSEIDIDFKFAEENDLGGLKSHYDDGVRAEEVDEDMEIEDMCKERLNEQKSNCSPNEEKLCITKPRKVLTKESEMEDFTEGNIERCFQEEDETEKKDKCEFGRAGNNKTGESNRTGNRKMRWSTKEVSLLKTTFHKYLAKNIYPTTDEIRKFLDKNNISRETCFWPKRMNKGESWWEKSGNYAGSLNVRLRS
ncbi:uncharacterized protein LOC108909779, partial [Anoplophora glabripennis]|uniref:uncharacterized protein LOC108909779 n=1 Tax=Anoplophora glabripennis TaxID=217634 RepID=UPI000874E00D